MSQGDLFAEPKEDKRPRAGQIAPREKIENRAGTVLDHRFTEPVKNYTGKVHGTVDRRQRIYQTGGEIDNFVYWSRRLVSIDMGVFKKIIPVVDWLEFIDHKKNECWRVALSVALNTGEEYNAGIGSRWGVPLSEFTITDGLGHPVPLPTRGKGR